jgi:hypothetical protein
LIYDILWLALLRLPVRCRYCRERYYLNFFSALKLRSRRAVRNIFTAKNSGSAPQKPLEILIPREHMLD